MNERFVNSVTGSINRGRLSTPLPRRLQGYYYKIQRGRVRPRPPTLFRKSWAGQKMFQIVLGQIFDSLLKAKRCWFILIWGIDCFSPNWPKYLCSFVGEIDLKSVGPLPLPRNETHLTKNDVAMKFAADDDDDESWWWQFKFIFGAKTL